MGGSLGITRCGGREFRWGERTYIMGIINLSPDSFSGDGLGSDIEAALTQAWRHAHEGADIIDIGGESTRPGADSVSPAEELRRVIPALERITREVPLPVSIDTYKLEVARRALEAGAAMINDVWGLKQEPGLAQLAAEKGVPLILTANQRDTGFQNVITEVTSSLKRSIDLALEAGVRWENIIIDPGIGFGKSLEQNLEILRHLEEFQPLGRPILLGTSRKSVIGLVLDLPPEERLEGTAATLAIGIAKGADIARVHDVRQMARVCRMSDAIIRGDL
jgi:dihydropteroate synthase